VPLDTSRPSGNGGEYFADVYPKATGRLALTAVFGGKRATILEYEVEE
jgi:hypothetical protein